MTTIATRIRRIADLEGFDLVVRRGGKKVDITQNGALGPYSWEKKLAHTKTVTDYKRLRFEACYPGYTCDVLSEDGSVAAGQTTLRTVRESYEEE